MLLNCYTLQPLEDSIGYEKSKQSNIKLLNLFCLTGPYPHHEIITRQLKIEGFMVRSWQHKDEASIKRMLKWMKEVSCFRNESFWFQSVKWNELNRYTYRYTLH